MYQTILQLLDGIVSAPLETLGVAAVLFHIQRGYILTRHILVPRYRYCRALCKNLQIIKNNFVQIATLHQGMQITGKDAESLTQSILRLNAEVSLPLLKARRIINPSNSHLFSEKLYSTMVECVKKLCVQHEYILLHNKCPDNFLSLKALESMIQELLDALPCTFWEPTSVYFRRIDLKFKRPKSGEKDFIDGLFALGQATKMGFSPSNDSSGYFTHAIKEAYLRKDETSVRICFLLWSKTYKGEIIGSLPL